MDLNPNVISCIIAGFTNKNGQEETLPLLHNHDENGSRAFCMQDGVNQQGRRLKIF